MFDKVKSLFSFTDEVASLDSQTAKESKLTISLIDQVSNLMVKAHLEQIRIKELFQETFLTQLEANASKFNFSINDLPIGHLCTIPPNEISTGTIMTAGGITAVAGGVGYGFLKFGLEMNKVLKESEEKGIPLGGGALTTSTWASLGGGSIEDGGSGMEGGRRSLYTESAIIGGVIITIIGSIVYTRHRTKIRNSKARLEGAIKTNADITRTINNLRAFLAKAKQIENIISANWPEKGNEKQITAATKIVVEYITTDLESI